MSGKQTLPATPEEAWRISSMILGSLPVVATLFALVTLWLRRGQPPTDQQLMTWVWLGQAIIEGVALVVLWNRMVKPLIPASGCASEPDLGSLNRLQAGLIVCMALVEGLALFGIVVHLIGGPAMLALISVALVWVGWMAFRPRRSWYGLR